MKISCKMAEDLLPLYLDEVCSEDSKAALREHLDSCEACREKLNRMRSQEPVPDITEKKMEMLSYAKKVRKHRIRTVIFAVCVMILAAIILEILCLTAWDLDRIANPTIYEVEEGVWNLTAEKLEVAAEDASQYVLFTNNTKIEVEVTAETDFSGTVKLYDAEYPDDFIMIGDVTQEDNTVTFQNLSAANLYIVSCEGMEGTPVTIGDGRVLSFWKSLCNVLTDIVSYMAEELFN